MNIQNFFGGKAKNENQIKTKHKLGQYFTTNNILKKKVLEFVINKPNIILEPSVGQGDLVQVVYNNNNNIQFDMYEIDVKIKMLDGIPNNVIYGDFIEKEVTKKYKTIIGNPPFVRTKTGNLYIDFIQKCYYLLENKGELVFIIPSDFFKLTSASRLLNDMIINGTFTHIYHPHKENLFENASIDVIVFRYCKDNTLSNKVIVNNQEKFLVNTNGIITFVEKDSKNMPILNEYFDVYVGMVTGKESVYKNEEFGDITLLNKKDQRDKYIFINEFPTPNDALNNYMLENKDILINRKIKKYTEKNWWLWGAPRNQKNIENNIGKKCIYVSNLTRNKEVAFEGKVEYFGGALLMLLPKQELDLKKIVEYLNSDTFKENYIFSKRFKIGHRQLSNSLFCI